MMHSSLISSIDELMKEKDKVVIAIDGGCASGKTTLTSSLAETYECNVFHIDNFFLQPHQRTEARLNTVGGNVDYERFEEEVLVKLSTNESFSYAPYCCKTLDLLPPIYVEPLKLNIIEGVYSMHPNLIKYYDLKVFLEVPYQTQIERITKRNSKMLKRFMEEWIPLEETYFTEMRIKEKCDLIFESVT